MHGGGFCEMDFATNESLFRHVYHHQLTQRLIVTREEKSILDYLKDTIRTTTQEKEITSHKPVFLSASGWGTLKEPHLPKTIKRTQKETGGTLRTYLNLEFQFDSFDHYEKTRNALQKILIEDWNAAMVFYLDKHDKELKDVYQLIIQTNQILNQKAYERAIDFITNNLGVTTNRVKHNRRIGNSVATPFPFTPLEFEQCLMHWDGEPLDLKALGFSAKATASSSQLTDKEINTGRNIYIAYREDHLNYALNRFSKDPIALELFNNESYAEEVFKSVTNALMQRIIPESFVTRLLNELNDEDLRILYEEVTQTLKRTPELIKGIRPISAYFPIIEEVQRLHPNIQNISQLLRYLLPVDFEGDADATTTDVAEIIHQFFEFGILTEARNDTDGLVIFNPLTGLWVHNEDDLIAMMHLIKRAVSQTDIDTIIRNWTATSNFTNHYIIPYSGSQYIVFENGVLDIQSLDLLPLNSARVKELNFTNRHQLKLSYQPNAPLVKFKNDTVSGDDWTIEAFINAYSDYDPHIKQYFLFGLALGLFPGHNSGVHFDIQGPSGAGKSTLATIFKGLYGPERVVEIVFSKLNEDFPISNFTFSTAIIWVRECNEGVAPLNDDKGTPFYDALADGQVQIPIKHKEDQIISNPPQMYIDGTRLIQSNDIQTGPARRTLAFKMPIEMAKPQYRKSSYSNNIHERLLDPRNLQWLVNEMIQAFRRTVPANRLSNFKMNLSMQEDVALLPEIAREWRQEFMSADENVKKWFEEMILPSLYVNHLDSFHHDEVFHKLYLQWYRKQNPQDQKARYAKSLRNFIKPLYQVMEEFKLYRVEFRDGAMRSRRRITSVNGWGFDWDQYDQDFIRPIELRDEAQWEEMYSKRVSKLYTLHTDFPDDQYLERKPNGLYVPTIPTSQLKEAWDITDNEYPHTLGKN